MEVESFEGVGSIEFAPLFDNSEFCDALKTQMTSLFSNVFARQLRFSGPDHRHVILQSLGSTSGDASTATNIQQTDPLSAMGGAGDSAHMAPRRYSSTQLASDSFKVYSSKSVASETSATSTRPQAAGTPTAPAFSPNHADQFLQLVSSTTVSASAATRSSAADPAPSFPSPHTPSSTESPKPLTRQGSSPSLSSLVRSSFKSYLPRHSSSTALSSLAEDSQYDHTSPEQQVSLNNQQQIPTDSLNTTSANYAVSNTTPQVLAKPSNQTNITSATAPPPGGDSTDGSNLKPKSGTSGSGLLSRTRQFGAWLGQITHSERKVEVTKKDLNVFAPTSF